ncbi:MAG: alanyl-tRNA editing protein [Candidatus Acidiferrales bacterium]
MLSSPSMTDRLYYHDSFLRSFDASVLSCELQPDGRFRVTLDRSAFYPASGGQPHDLGTLGGVPVVEVADASAPPDHFVHFVSAAVPAGPVHAEIDWPRRFDHMQQHTAQHLLSAVFIELFGFPTVSFHLGGEISTIDLQAPSVVSRHLAEAECRVNEIVFEDRVVSVRFGTAGDLAAAGARKSVAREGTLRAIEIEGLDLQPCGGTHLSRTGQAGLLLLRRLERRRDSWRIEFVAGFRSLGVARADFSTLGRAADLFSCGPSEVPAIVEKIIDERRSLYSSEKRRLQRLAMFEARDLLAAHASAAQASPRVIAAVVEEDSFAYLNALAGRLLENSGIVALLVTRATGLALFAKSKELPADMSGLFRETANEIPAKGGGSSATAQGTLSDPARAADFLACAQSRLVS